MREQKEQKTGSRASDSHSDGAQASDDIEKASAPQNNDPDMAVELPAATAIKQDGTPAPLAAAPLAYENPSFLKGPDGRLIRIVAEYMEPLARFRREHIQDTVVFFGSARFRGKA